MEGEIFQKMEEFAYKLSIISEKIYKYLKLVEIFYYIFFDNNKF